MTSNIEQKLILDFLMKNYPPQRIKINGHFKRALLIENEVFLLNKETDYNRLENNIRKILTLVFDSEPQTIEKALRSFLITK